MSAPANGTLVFSRFDSVGGWQLVSPTGTLLGTVAGTPIDPGGHNCYWMGRLANGRIGVATAFYLWTLNPDLTMPPVGGPTHVPASADLFSGGTNGTYIYKIDGTFGAYKFKEIDPTTWTVLRQWSIAENYGFPEIAVDPGATVAYYGDSIVKKLDLTTGIESTFKAVAQSGLLVLADNSVLIAENAATRRYDPAGVLMTTYPKPVGSSQGSLALGLSSRSSFWLNSDATGVGECHLWEFDYSTATVLNNFELPDDTLFNWTSPFAVIEQPVPPATYTICRLRRAPHLNNERKRVYHHRFELDMETGLGLSEIPATAPDMRLRYSDDGGHEWSAYRTMSAGAEGDYTTRMFLNRLGSSRDRIYEVSTCDDAAWRLLAAYLDLEPGTGN